MKARVRAPFPRALVGGALKNEYFDCTRCLARTLDDENVLAFGV